MTIKKKEKNIIATLGINLQKDNIDQLKELADKEDRSVSSLVRMVIKEYLKQNKDKL